LKLATFRSLGSDRIAIVHDNDRMLFDLARASERAGSLDPAFTSMVNLIDAGDAALGRARGLFERSFDDPSLSVELSGVQLLAPVPEPRQMRDGMSFPVHILQSQRGLMKSNARARNDVAELDRISAEALPQLPEIYRKQPIYYITNRFSVGAPGSTVMWPKYSQLMDYELELGVFTKGKAANISAKNASDHIFGFTIYNDFSARDVQAVEMEGRLGPAKGKSFNGGNVLGPWIVTRDEIGDPYDLGVEVRVNGQTRSTGATRGMLFSFEEMIEYISRDETLMPAEFIGSGTVGNCCGLELGWFLEDGDAVDLEIQRIGILSNVVRRQQHG
jgi:2-keto-4-pentenoate hydratase/2-oxohepta-3-ene-1,7-dioic acid hydratase in catechol pathway